MRSAAGAADAEHTMPPRTRRIRFPDHAVTAVLVSHDGAAWLPECLQALSVQTRPPQRVVAVDTGSTDESPALLSAALGDTAVVGRPRETALGTAVQSGLDAFAGAAMPAAVATSAQEWVWLLHDDCAPDPDALAHLLERAEESPSATVVAPKVLDWERRRLVEVGVTTDSSGFRETGLEPREVDQGQHDDVSDVLAAGTAGLLIRRDTWDALGGFDPAWSFVGEDVDFGWRVNASGGRVVVAPRAVVRHASALASGRRRADALSLPTGAVKRAHGMQVVLANTSPWLVVPLMFRYVLEALLRAVGALLLRSPGRSRDELLGIATVVGRPAVVFGARRRRRSYRRRPHRQVRGLLAPASWRWRHAGDALAGLVAGRAALDERRRRRAPVETGPVAAEAESFAVDDLGVVAGVVTRPGVIVALALTVIALIADRALLGGDLHGGRLLAAPGGASDLWSSYGANWHSVGLGSTATTPPAIAVLALISTVLLGKVWLAVDVLLLGAIPLAGTVAYLASGAVTRRRWLRAVGAVAYATMPPLFAAVTGGRIDAVVAIVLAPAVFRAVAAAIRRPALHRAAGAGVLLTVEVAVAPAAWVVTAVSCLVCVPVFAGARDPLDRSQRLSARAAAALLVVALPVLVLLPWSWDALTTPRLALSGAGLPDTLASHRGLSAAQILLVHPGGGAQPPLWAWAPVVLGGVVALLTARVVARVAFVVFAAATAVALAVARATPTGAVDDARYWTGALLAIAALGALAGALTAVDAGPSALSRRAFGWRQLLAATLAVAGVVGVATAAVTWVARGSAHPLSSSTASVLPVFAQAEAAAPTAPKVLVLQGSGRSVHYAVLRGPQGLRLGDADVTSQHGSPGSVTLAAAVADAAAGRAKAADELTALGIVLVVVPRDDDQALAGLARIDGLARVPATSSVVYRATRPAGELVVLHGADAQAAASGGLPSPKSKPQLLAATPGSAHTTVAADLSTTGTGERLLVLAEPRAAAWRATLAGHRLRPAVAYGWAQAWVLPSTGGVVKVSYDDGGRHRWLVIEALLLAVAVVLCLPKPRRHE